MTIVGETQDRSQVLAGVFEFYDTHGIPLPIVLDWMIANKLVPCWPSFIASATKAGWKRRTLESRLREAVVDSFGSEYWTSIASRV